MLRKTSLAKRAFCARVNETSLAPFYSLTSGEFERFPTVSTPTISERVFVPPPPILFKYAGRWAEGMFTDPFLRFSSPVTFNDPFEFFPTIDLRGGRHAREFL